MNSNAMMIGGFAITVGTITFYELKHCQTLPWPPRIVATGVVFGLLDLLSMFSTELSGVIAVGIVLAAIVNKGFNSAPNCEHTEVGTVQTTAFESLDTGPSMEA